MSLFLVYRNGGYYNVNKQIDSITPYSALEKQSNNKGSSAHEK